MSWRPHLLLLFALTIIAGAALVDHYASQPAAMAPLLPLAAAAVTAIELEHNGEIRCRYQRHEESWQRTPPVMGGEISEEVALLLQLPSLQPLRQLPLDATTTLALYGLDPPRLTLRFNQTISVGFGDQAPLAFQRYLLTATAIALVKDGLYGQISLLCPPPIP
ncbi:MAG: hypothetical protein HQL48_01555 [Gammaproteobacteria bacterium]|nr:hypothetical protein [Gammaproteobacteria bacterium]